jgi:hypothetical protein
MEILVDEKYPEKLGHALLDFFCEKCALARNSQELARGESASPVWSKSNTGWSIFAVLPAEVKCACGKHSYNLGVTFARPVAL